MATIEREIVYTFQIDMQELRALYASIDVWADFVDTYARMNQLDRAGLRSAASALEARLGDVLHAAGDQVNGDGD